jgi:SAM-dependent methyltransferase
MTHVAAAAPPHPPHPPTPDASSAVAGLDVDALREAIREEYSAVAAEPERGFHFHTGRPLALLLGYDEALLDGIPEPTVASFAGTGNPFLAGRIAPGARVVDVGCGAGIDTLIAARMAGDGGLAIGVDMTPAMLEKARAGARSMGAANVEFRDGYAEALPIDDEWADVVISNGALNLIPDKLAGLRAMARCLRPGGRLQVGDILVAKPVPDGAKRDIGLWKG